MYDRSRLDTHCISESLFHPQDHQSPADILSDIQRWLWKGLFHCKVSRAIVSCQLVSENIRGGAPDPETFSVPFLRPWGRRSAVANWLCSLSSHQLLRWVADQETSIHLLLPRPDEFVRSRLQLNPLQGFESVTGFEIICASCTAGNDRLERLTGQSEPVLTTCAWKRPSPLARSRQNKQ